MKCFRCKGLDFDLINPTLFGFAVVQCSNCTQQFSIGDKTTLTPVELLGSFDDIANECIILNCNVCGTRRYISVDCSNLNMQSCKLCKVETTVIGDKIPLAEFLTRSSRIDVDTLN